MFRVPLRLLLLVAKGVFPSYRPLRLLLLPLLRVVEDSSQGCLHRILYDPWSLLLPQEEVSIGTFPERLGRPVLSKVLGRTLLLLLLPVV
jgi:hypothetical protein